MELNGNITPGASLEGSFDFDSGDYNNLKNKPSINGVTLEGNKTSSDLHIDTGGGGGGGTTDYDQLDNRPAINGHTLTGDQSAEDLGIITGYPVELPTPADPSKYLDGSGNWSEPPTGGDCEIIPITNGTGTTSRTFTFTKEPKFLKFYYKSPSLYFNTDFTIVYGQDFYNYLAHQNQVQITGGSGACGAATYNDNEITLTAGNAFGCCNDADGTGFIFVIY